MHRLLSERVATFGLLIILSGFVLFHLLILMGMVPYESVWGGRLKSREEMISFETPALLVNLIFLGMVAIKARLLKIRMYPLMLKVVFWAMFGLFIVNMVGNLLSADILEKTLFALCTLLLALFSLRLATSSE